MTALQIARNVVETKTAHVYRPRAGDPAQYDSKPWGTHGRSGGWRLLDMTTAHVIVTVHDSLQQVENRQRMQAMPLEQMARVALKVAARGCRREQTQEGL